MICSNIAILNDLTNVAAKMIILNVLLFSVDNNDL